MATHEQAAREGTVAIDRPRLVVVCGLPGVGKTTVARAVADRVDGALLRTDVVRKDLWSDPSYTEEETRAVYERVLEEARGRIEGGRDVVLDGTFRTAEFRNRAAALAGQVGAEFDLVKVDCADDVVRERIDGREGDESDADFEVHRMLREQFDPLRTDHVAVDNSGAPEDAYRQVAEHL